MCPQQEEQQQNIPGCPRPPRHPLRSLPLFLTSEPHLTGSGKGRAGDKQRGGLNRDKSPRSTAVLGDLWLDMKQQGNRPPLTTPWMSHSRGRQSEGRLAKLTRQPGERRVHEQKPFHLPLRAAGPRSRRQRRGREFRGLDSAQCSGVGPFLQMRVCVCGVLRGSVTYSSVQRKRTKKTTKPNNHSPLTKDFSLGPTLRLLKLNPMSLDLRQKPPAPIHLSREAPTMKLHLVIVSEIYLYCLCQSICPS